MRGAFRSLRVLSPDMLRAFCLASVSLERKNLFLDLTGGDRLIRDVGLQNRPDEYCAVRVAGVGSHARQRVEEKRLSIVRPTAALPYSERELNPHKPFGLSDFKSDASTDSATRANLFNFHNVYCGGALCAFLTPYTKTTFSCFF